MAPNAEPHRRDPGVVGGVEPTQRAAPHGLFDGGKVRAIRGSIAIKNEMSMGPMGMMGDFEGDFEGDLIWLVVGPPL